MKKRGKDTNPNELARLLANLSWTRALPAYIKALKSGKPEAEKLATEELKRMAEAADAYNEIMLKVTQH